jgi:UDP-galactopyranose mutase
MSRFGRGYRVFYVEEPDWESGRPSQDIEVVGENVWVVKPRLPANLAPATAEAVQGTLLDDLIQQYNIESYLLWYYTPAALTFSSHLRPEMVVYDCMDELSLFKGASADLCEKEQALFDRADIVFTGGPSLYEAKRTRHDNTHLFPSSIDFDHFYQARYLEEPADQALIPHPRLGFFGVIDERFDIELVEAIATSRPDWQLVLVGPVVKIDPKLLPHRHNIHYLGMRPYNALPAYLSGWDVALLPFAQNDATRFISPTKTPEYLAGGKPVVSTPIRDVIHLYGHLDMVHIAPDASEFIASVEEILANGVSPSWLAASDRLLAQSSWDCTWSEMQQRLEAVTTRNGRAMSR